MDKTWIQVLRTIALATSYLFFPEHLFIQFILLMKRIYLSHSVCQGVHEEVTEPKIASDGCCAGSV